MGPNQPQGHLEPSQTSTRECFCKKSSDHKLLTIFAKELHRRCWTWFQICLIEHDFTFKIF